MMVIMLFWAIIYTQVKTQMEVLCKIAYLKKFFSKSSFFEKVVAVEYLFSHKLAAKK